MNMPKSRKQRREEERALRSGIVGEAFSNSTSATTTVVCLSGVAAGRAWRISKGYLIEQLEEVQYLHMYLAK